MFVKPGSMFVRAKVLHAYARRDEMPESWAGRKPLRTSGIRLLLWPHREVVQMNPVNSRGLDSDMVRIDVAADTFFNAAEELAQKAAMRFVEQSELHPMTDDAYWTDGQLLTAGDGWSDEVFCRVPRSPIPALQNRVAAWWYQNACTASDLRAVVVLWVGDADDPTDVD